MSQKEFYKNLPRKRMAAGALIFNPAGQLLLVKPNYKDYWSIPGGVVDEEESPRQACLREVKEEIGIDLKQADFVCVDWLPTRKDKSESLQFMFYGGVLNDSQISSIKVDADEIKEYRFIDLKDSTDLLGGSKRNLVKRLLKCLEAIKNKSSIYLEDSQERE